MFVMTIHARTFQPLALTQEMPLCPATPYHHPMSQPHWCGGHFFPSYGPGTTYPWKKQWAKLTAVHHWKNTFRWYADEKTARGGCRPGTLAYTKPLPEMQAVGKHQDLKFSAWSVENSGQSHYRDVQILNNFHQSFFGRPLMAFTSRTKALLLVAEPQTSIQQPVTEFSPSCTTFCEAASCWGLDVALIFITAAALGGNPLFKLSWVLFHDVLLQRN